MNPQQPFQNRNAGPRTVAPRFLRLLSRARLRITQIHIFALIGWALLPGWAAFAGAVPSASVASSFESANKLYEQGKFAEAAAAYEKMTLSGPVSAPLYFNFGNSLFKSGHVGDAIVVYRQAQALAPRDPDLRANLQFVRDQVQGPTLPPNIWLRRLGRITLNEWTVLSSLALWVWLLLLALGQVRPGLKASLRTGTYFSGAATAVLCACLAAVLTAESRPMAVVITHEAAVRNGPLDESPSVFTAHDGAELSVLDGNEHWLQVSAGNRRVGWVEKDRVRIATPLLSQ